MLGNSRKRWRTERREEPDPKQELNKRFWILRIGILVAFVALTLQLANLQLIRGSDFKERAELNQLRVEPVIPPRGLIYDRNGVPLVENIPSFSAAVVAADVPEDRTLEIAAGVHELLGVPPMETVLKIEEKRQSNNPFIPAILKDGLTQDEAFRLRENIARLPGVQVLVEPVRRYVAGPEVSSVLGYMGRVDEQDYAELKDKGYIASDRIGKAGVEATYETYLRGLPGEKEIEKDASGREIRVLREIQAQPGNDVVLSIDLDLQKKVTEMLSAAAGGGQGAAVVMDVRTGEVLALVSLPLYDNNVFSGKIDEARLEQYLNDSNKPLVNKAISEQYAPGSIFKQITGSAALQEGVATPSTTITSNGYINIPNEYDPSIVYTFRDWRVLGTLDFYGGVAMSSDVYFYYLAGGYHAYGQSFDGLGVKRLVKYAGAFGIGRPTGIDLVGEASGNLPSPEWKLETWGDEWRLGDTYNMGIGQGYVAATPIQMVRVTSAIANGGELMTPHVVREVRDAEGRVIVPPGPRVESQLPVSASNLSVMREAMRQAVSWGSASLASVPGLQVGGKTGTAEFGPRFADGTYETHGWFSGFAPYEDPQIAVTVFLDHGIGGVNAAPLGGKILEYYFRRQQQQVARDGGAPQGVTP